MIYYEKSSYIKVVGKLAKLSLLSGLAGCIRVTSSLILFLISGGMILPAQTVSVNNEGKRVVVFEDGSWRYFEAADSMLLKVGSEVPLEVIMEQPSDDEVTGELSIPIYNYQTYLDYLKAARSYEADLADKVDYAQDHVYQVEDAIQFAKAKNNRNLFEQKRSELKAAHEVLNESQKTLGNWRKQIGKIEKIGVKGNFQKLAEINLPPNYLGNDSELATAQQPALQETSEQTMRRVSNPISAKTEVRPDRETKKQTKSNRQVEESTSSAGPVTQMATNSVQFLMTSFSSGQSNDYNCQFAYEGLDEFTRQEKKELVEELLFTFTDDRLKPYFKEREHVTCHAYLTSLSGGFRYLNLVFRIASKTAQREYGLIAKNTLVNLKLMNGKTVSLYCQKGDIGNIDPSTGDTIYRATFQIDAQKERMILKSELDKIRVVWSTGYEDYDVHNVDLLMNQLGCLETK